MADLTLTRRMFNFGLAAGTGALMAPSLSWAGASAHEIKVGDITVNTISDGHFTIPTAFFPNLAEKVAEVPEGPLRLGANIWVVKAGARLVLVDTGSADAWPTVYPDVGLMPAELKAQGIDAAAVTDVIITHMHPDHIGGLVAGGASAFPNATVHFLAAEWDFWTDAAKVATLPEHQAGMFPLIEALVTPIRAQVQVHQGEADLGDGISIVPTPGHTPGHAAVRLSSGNDQFMIIGDALIAEALHFSHPDVTWGLDADAAQAVTTRLALLDMLATDQIRFAATHLEMPGAGVVEKSGDGYKFIALD